MTTPTSITPHQADLIKTAAAIISVVDDSSMHGALQQTVPLTQDQINALAHRFSDGLDRWESNLRSHRTPSPFEISRIAIVTDLLDDRYPTAVTRDQRGEITLPVSDIVDSWKDLGADITQYSVSRSQWEDTIRAYLGIPTAGEGAASGPNQQRAAAQRVGLAIARSMGIDGIFNTVVEAGYVPQTEVPALPAYSEKDARNGDPQLMARLQLSLSVTKGLLQALTPATPNEDHRNHLIKFVQQRTNLALDRISGLIIPSGLSSFSAQLSDSQAVLQQTEKLLELCLYGDESALADAAAEHAVERSVGMIAFLSIFPNIPFIIPTLELRLTITRPLMGVTRAAHSALGKIPIFGFLFLLLRWIGQAIDAIPRFQVRLFQGLQKESWLGRPSKRAQLIKRYLHYADRRATKPRVDVIPRILLSIVQ